MRAAEQVVFQSIVETFGDVTGGLQSIYYSFGQIIGNSTNEVVFSQRGNFDRSVASFTFVASHTVLVMIVAVKGMGLVVGLQYEVFGDVAMWRGEFFTNEVEVQTVPLFAGLAYGNSPNIAHCKTVRVRGRNAFVIEDLLVGPLISEAGLTLGAVIEPLRPHLAVLNGGAGDFDFRVDSRYGFGRVSGLARHTENGQIGDILSRIFNHTVPIVSLCVSQVDESHATVLRENE